MRAILPLLRVASGRLVLSVFLFCVDASAQLPVDQMKRLEELERKMKQLDPNFQPPATFEDRMKALEAKLDQLLAEKITPPPPAVVAQAPTPPPAAPPAATPGSALVSPQQSAGPVQSVVVSGDYKATTQEVQLPVSGYMDFHFNKERGDSWRPDFHRFVLLFGHSFSDRIKFWSEFELEHSLVEGGEESGEIALEQAYLDFLIRRPLNPRAGMVLMPVGIVNERHEPPSFNGVERPFVETVIIPTTWRELGFGLTGDIGRGFRYRSYMTSALNARFFNAEFGIADGKTSGFDANMRNPAFVGRLEYGGVRRLTLGTSFYSGKSGFDTPGVNPRVTIASFDGRYSWRQFDVRGLFANIWISDAAALNSTLQFQTGVNPNVASQLRGYYVEPAYHLLPRRMRHDIVAFARYENYNTQQVMPAGYQPLEQFSRWSWITGVTYKPHPDVAVKFDYGFNRNRSSVVQAVDSINLGLGWWF